MPPSCHGRHSDRLSRTLRAHGRGWEGLLAPEHLGEGEERRGEGKKGREKREG